MSKNFPPQGTRCELAAIAFCNVILIEILRNGFEFDAVAVNQVGQFLYLIVGKVDELHAAEAVCGAGEGPAFAQVSDVINGAAVDS